MGNDNAKKEPWEDRPTMDDLIKMILEQSK